ncbi:MAG TPA: hypothetical protein VND99_01795 [Candidatus Acidoferrales bacterium]|nr:hypothetical protein [Candidatus Acidoferrales bacterium]
MKTENFIGKLSLIILSGAIIPLFFPKNAWADGVSLKVSPATFRIEAKPPADVWAPFTIENYSNQPIHLTIGYKPFNSLASQNGSITFLPNNQTNFGKDKKIFQKMQVVDDKNISHDTIDLGPKQKEHLRLRINLPDQEPANDYYFSLILLENPVQSDQNITKGSKKDQKSFSAIQTGIGINVLLAIGDKILPQGSIGTFTTTPFQETGPIPFTLTVFNDGLHFFNPKGTIQVKNMFGQTVGKVLLPSSVILAGTGRTYTSKYSQSYANNFWDLTGQNMSQQLIWPENYPLGMYTATLSLSLSEKGPTFTRSIHFFVFPLTFLFQMLIAVGIVFYIIHRVKKKLSK